jgi:uncharacterized SAM-binding protein YcdF (DUF218 family)
VIKILVLPPVNAYLLALVGFLIYRRWPRTGLSLIGAAFAALLMMSTPACSRGMLNTLEVYPALTAAEYRDDVGAIVVLGAEAYSPAAEFGVDTIGPVTLERVRYGARLHRATGVPILTSGGIIRPAKLSLGETMAAALEDEFGVPVLWRETTSSNTYENARQSAAILRAAGVGTIYLVTTASHMRRATESFEAMGLEVIPAPTALTRRPKMLLVDFFPRAYALHESREALYEWFGLLWYRAVYL